MAAANAGIPVAGVDINPVGILLSHTKLKGFDSNAARSVAEDVIARAIATKNPTPIDWSGKGYWFTPGVVDKLERLRTGVLEVQNASFNERSAVLLSLALSVRLCSKADQRSPKPFISETARQTRYGRHFDPYSLVRTMLSDLSSLYGDRLSDNHANVVLADFVNDRKVGEKLGTYSHVVTSPPYINAQDYFRNFKLELYVLENLLPFQVDKVKDKFIGTDRGPLTANIAGTKRAEFRSSIHGLESMEQRTPRLAAVVYRYLHDMRSAFDRISECLEPGGKFVLVCGDNIVGGLRIRTWEVLQEMLLGRGFVVLDTFRDLIRDRLLAPKRSGHKGLIKEEVVCCYERPQENIR